MSQSYESIMAQLDNYHEQQPLFVKLWKYYLTEKKKRYNASLIQCMNAIQLLNANNNPNIGRSLTLIGFMFQHNLL